MKKSWKIRKKLKVMEKLKVIKNFRALEQEQGFLNWFVSKHNHVLSFFILTYPESLI